MNKIAAEVRDGIQIISISNPPVNALSHEVRSGLVEAVERAGSRRDVAAIVIYGEGRTFPAGADIREFGNPPMAPWLPEVCNRIEAVEKPLVAAIHGTALGGGLEVALASHYRIADSKARLGFPEVNLGLLPGAGGTQRTPRLCGVEHALDLMLSGKPIGAASAAEIGLVDKVVDDGLVAAAIAFARELARDAVPVRRSRDAGRELLEGIKAAASIRKRKDRLEAQSRVLPAPARIVECVEAAVNLDFEDGLATERRLFSDCLASPQSSALRHVFFAERKASKFPELSTGSAHSIREAGIVGGGTMGSAIAAACLQSGLKVVLVERSEEQLEKAAGSIERIFSESISRGKLTEPRKTELLSSLEMSVDYGSLDRSDIIVEAVFEDFAVKRRVVAEMEAVAKRDAVLASNTSYLDIDELGRALAKPERFVGLHFFAPANIMKLLEVVVGDRTSPDAVAACVGLAKKLGKIPVRSGVCDGFIGNRIGAAYREACDQMLLVGATPYLIDEAMRDFGMRMGPFESMDLSGLDISWLRRKRLKSVRDRRLRYCRLADALCELTRFGRKSGRGFYIYDEKGRPRPDGDVLSLLEEIRAEAGCKSRPFEFSEIQNRAHAAMVNEASKVVEEGIACRPSDIDVVEIHGYGYPRWRGGPMKFADDLGLESILSNIRIFGETDPLFWVPSPLLAKLADRGSAFSDLN